MPPFSRRTPLLVVPVVLPTLLVLAGLVMWGDLTIGQAALAGLAVILLLLGLLWPVAADMDRAIATLRSLEDGDDVPPPEPSSRISAELLGALGRLVRGRRALALRQTARIESQETLFDALPGPLLLIDRQTRIRRANRAARLLFSGALVGGDLARILRFPNLLDSAERVLHGEPADEIEITLTLPEERQFRALLAPLRAAGPEEAGAVLALQDVTEIKRIERMRADFVANASHELRTPLSVLLGFIETLQGPAKDDEDARERFLAIMHDQAARMSRLVADLLTLSRIELYEHSKAEGRCDIGALLRRIAAGLELAARDRKVRIILDLADDLPPVTGQDDEISQIFQNLMDNALKYGRAGTSVEVSARPMSSGETPLVAVTVRDHGEGIAREHLPRLTERFFRVDAARSREMGGTGLGLAIVKHAINRHRGTLAIDSSLGEGSRFTVTLPASP